MKDWHDIKKVKPFDHIFDSFVPNTNTKIGGLRFADCYYEDGFIYNKDGGRVYGVTHWMVWGPP